MNVDVHGYSKTLVNKLFLENFDINLWKILKVVQKIFFFFSSHKIKISRNFSYTNVLGHFLTFLFQQFITHMFDCLLIKKKKI